MRFGVIALMLAAAAYRQPRSLWHDPGDITALDFGGSAGSHIGAPKPPFIFVKEDASGTQPKVFVHDAAGIDWNVKFGYEVKNEAFCWRIVRACGYFAEPSYFVPSGRIQGLQPLKRPTPSIHPDGQFTDARFQYRDPNLTYLNGRNWRWDGPPYVGTKELSGLKILIMLFSNWDDKDGRAGDGGPNTAIFELHGEKSSQLLYAFTDWGSGMGRWGATTGQTNWRCADYAAQSPGFVKGVVNGHVQFAWEGDINSGFKTNIPPAHVAWFMQYLGKITDAQLHAALKAGGASEAEADCYTKAMRSRIEQLKTVAAAVSSK